MFKEVHLLSFIWSFIKRQKWVFLAILILDCLAFPLDSLLWPYVLNLVTNVFTDFESQREAAWAALQTPILMGLSLVLFVEVSSRLMGFLMTKSIPKLQAEIRMRMFDHVQRHSPRYFHERLAGGLANRITEMVTQTDWVLQELFFPIIPAIATCVLGAFFLWHVNPIFTYLLIGWIAIHLSVCFAFLGRIEAYEKVHGEARTSLMGRVVDSLTNNFNVNLFYRFQYEHRLISDYQKSEEDTNVSAKKYVERMRCFLSLFYLLVVVLGMFGLMIYFWVEHVISTGQVIQVFTTMWSISMLLWSVGTSLPVVFQSLGLMKQAYSVMNDPEDLGDKPGAKELQVTKGEITFSNVSFQYGKKKLFRNKQVVIRGGERIGLVGYSGAGKSTFINLILRLLPVEDGQILIDGQNVADVSLESLRKQIALIPQEPMLFHRTLRENIAYGCPDATEEQILHAARLAHCDEFIQNLPEGYDSKVGERGAKLSGGERQRVAIARAILVNAPILLLDEATSALDSVTEQLIQDSLDQLMRNRTTLVIAHRLSTLSRMDRILVFDKGSIVEQGTHAALLKKNGHYARMWTMQVGGFLPDQPE